MRISKHAVAAAAGFGIVVASVAGWTGGVRAASAHAESAAAVRPVERASSDREALDAQQRRAQAAFASLPAAFVENQGQMDARVRYYAQGDRYAFYLTRDAVALSFLEGSDAASGVALTLRFVGANPAASLGGRNRAAGDVNYFRGNDPSGWRTAVPRFGEVAYRELWPGVEMRLREQAGTLKYEFHVQPGARAADIRLAYAGAAGLALDATGGLLVNTAIGVLRDSPPVSFQIVDGSRVPVESRYVLVGGTSSEPEYGFVVGAGYQPDRELIIDPGLQYSTLIGGSSHELANGVKVDASGNAYVTGVTQSPDFPTTAGAFRRTGAVNNFSEVFVSKLNASGTALLYSTFIGGSDLDFGRRIAIDAAGNAYVTGQTKSSDFPTTAGAFDRSFNIPPNCPRCAADNYDGFVLKLNATGSALLYSTYLGGTDIDSPRGIAVDGSGNAFVVGETLSTDFPTTAGAFARTLRGDYDIFVTKLNPAGSALVYSTFLGGSLSDNGERVQVDAAGNAYVLGFSGSTDFPTTAGAFDTTANGGFDVTLTKLNPSGSGLVYSTYLGGQGFDSGGGLAIDAAGNAYISGTAGSVDFPITAGAFQTTPDGSDVFVTKVNPAGSALVYSSIVGGTGADGGNGIAIDPAGNAWVTGITNSPDFPVTPGAFANSFNGVADAVVFELSASGSTLLYSTYLGGTNSEGGDDIAVDATGKNVYVVGHTYSADFPTTAGAFDIVFKGNTEIFWGDGFVARFATDTTTSTPPSTPPTPGAPALQSPSNNDAPPQPITFTWGAAAAAASYTIQIDDSSAFSAPLVREQQNLTVLRYGTTGLAARPHFWRVRGVNTAGVAGPWSTVRTFTPQAPPPPAGLTNLDINPATVVGGNPSSGTIVLSSPAPDGGAVVSLSSSNPAVVGVPATATAPSVSFTGTFTVTTSAVSVNTIVTITALYNGSTRTATLTVTPPASSVPLPSVQGLTLNPANVVGGSSSLGTVTLSGAAPQGGALVSLSNGNTAAATIPASVTVPAGSTSATFIAATKAVSVQTLLSVSASYNGTNATAVLTVNPSAPPPPPQTATLTVNATGRSGVTVSSTPVGISVATGSSGSASFTPGTSVTLKASGGRSVVWSGACSSGGNKTASCTFTFNAAATVTANVQ